MTFLIVLMKRSSSLGQYVTSISAGYRARPKLAHSLPGPGFVEKEKISNGWTVMLPDCLRCQGMLTCLQPSSTVENRFLIGPQIVEGPLADFGTEILNLVIDLLKRQVEGKLPHLFHQSLGLLSADRVLLVRP